MNGQVCSVLLIPSGSTRGSIIPLCPTQQHSVSFGSEGLGQETVFLLMFYDDNSGKGRLSE